MQTVELKRTRRLRAGHPWVYANELARSPRGHAPGSLVELRGRGGEPLGVGYINPHSLIAVRLLSRELRPIDRAFFAERLRAAVALRQRLLPGRAALRLVHGEADGLPGLVADRYGGCLVLSFLTAGMEAQRELLIDLLSELCEPQALVLRNDSPFRQLEGLELGRELVYGELASPLLVEEGGILLEVDPLEGQKTGLYLDQADNRLAFAGLAGGAGQRGLDLFCYRGAWSLHLAQHGAQVLGVDSSQPALDAATRAAARSGLAERLRFERHDVFDFLARAAAEERRFDFAAVDPPAFVKSKQRLKEALRAYRELNALALGVLRPGALVASSSCSHHVGRELFVDVLRQAARDAGRRLRLIALRGAGPDHPVDVAIPETEYLCCAFCVVD